MKLLARNDKTIEVEFDGENETLLNLLKAKLLENPEVDGATFILGHPLLDKPKLILTARTGKPEQHLRSAAKDLRVAFDAFETAAVNARV